MNSFRRWRLKRRLRFSDLQAAAAFIRRQLKKGSWDELLESEDSGSALLAFLENPTTDGAIRLIDLCPEMESEVTLHDRRFPELSDLFGRFPKSN